MPPRKKRAGEAASSRRSTRMTGRILYAERRSNAGPPCEFSGRHEMLYRAILLLLPLAAVSLASESASAQMFGSRNLGNPLAKRANPGTDTGTIRGNERFIRGNRGRNDFVGSDVRDLAGFVGSQLATTTLAPPPPPGQVDLESAASRINRPLTRRTRNVLYSPRLTVGFDYTPAPNADLAARLKEHLDLTPTVSQAGELSVSVEGSTAILTGTVSSAHDRELAELLVRFEPGVEDVRNEVVVAPRSTPPLPR
jgi:hypothetical protein